MLKNFRKAAVAVSFLCMLCAVPAQAATLDHAEVCGFEQLDEETKSRILTALEQVPQEVLGLQKAKGGSIVFKNQVMDENGNAVSGLYWLSGPDANDIWVKVGETYPYSSTYHSEGRTLAHELGHFIHGIWKPSKTDEDINTLNERYQYWSQHTDSCQDADETFATLYSGYVCGDRMTESEQRLFERAEQYMIDLYKRLPVVNGKVVYGPSAT